MVSENINSVYLYVLENMTKMDFEFAEGKFLLKKFSP